MKIVQEQAGMHGFYHVLSFAKQREITPQDLERARRYVRRGDVAARAGLPIFREYKKHNVVPDNGKNVFARVAASDVTYTGKVNYGALGSGSTAFTSSSTQLNTEVFRKLTSGGEAIAGVAYIDFFYDAGDVADATYNEFGAFVDGTASANTGRATSLITTGGWVKAGALFVTLQLTFA